MPSRSVARGLASGALILGLLPVGGAVASCGEVIGLSKIDRVACVGACDASTPDVDLVPDVAHRDVHVTRPDAATHHDARADAPARAETGPTCMVDGGCTAACTVPSDCPGDAGTAAMCCQSVCTDTDTDPTSCGMCGQSCSTANVVAVSCAAGVCDGPCATGFGDCDNDKLTNGCETSLTANDQNCGMCGNVCGAGFACQSSGCVSLNPFLSTGAEGAFNPAMSTVLPPGIHNFTTITVGAGIIITTSGSGILDLRATGDITIAGTINVSGGAGGSTTINGSEPGGGGGNTGNPGTEALGVAGTGGQGTAAPATAGGAPGGNFGGGPGGGETQGLCGAGGGGYAGGGGGSWTGTCTGGSAAGGAGPSVGGVGGGAAVYNGAAGTASSIFSGGGGGSIGPAAVADLKVATTFQPGSGGGGGSGDNFEGAGGGGGGGALRLSSETSIKVTGQLLANGGIGGTGGTSGCALVGGAGGGGGSGGVIYLIAPTLDVPAGASVSAAGGGGGPAPCQPDPGGAGGLGRIRISALAMCTLAGTFDPPLASGCNASAAAGTPYVAAFPN